MQLTGIRKGLGEIAGTNFPILFNTPIQERKPMALQVLLCDMQLRKKNRYEWEKVHGKSLVGMQEPTLIPIQLSEWFFPPLLSEQACPTFA